MTALESENVGARIDGQPSEARGDGALDVAGQEVPDAQIGPDEERTRDIAAAIETLRRYRRENYPTLGDITIRELIDDGRDRQIALLLGSGDDEDDRGE